MKEQRDFAQADAELAHHRTVEQTVFVEQKHPVVELHLIDMSIDRQPQRVTPVQCIAGRDAVGSADHIGGETAPLTLAGGLQMPDAQLGAAVAVMEVFGQHQLLADALAVHIDAEAFEQAAVAVLG